MTPADTQAPTLPDRIKRLHELAYDLWWTWNGNAREVFRRLDYPLWRQTAHNPVLMLRMISPELLDRAASDSKFLSLYDAAMAALDAARAAHDTWWRRAAGIAWFTFALPYYATRQLVTVPFGKRPGSGEGCRPGAPHGTSHPMRAISEEQP